MLKYWIVKLFYSSSNNMYMDGWIKECIKSLFVKNYIVPARVCKFFQQIAAKLIPILTSKDILANLGWKLEWTCMITFCQLSVCSSSICMWFILLSYGFPVVWLLMDGFFYDFSYRNKLQRQLFQQFYLYYRIHQTVLLQVKSNYELNLPNHKVKIKCLIFSTLMLYNV